MKFNVVTTCRDILREYHDILIHAGNLTLQFNIRTRQIVIFLYCTVRIMNLTPRISRDLDDLK